MKKIVLLLAVSLTTWGAFASEVKVDPRILKAFQNDFATANNVRWSVRSEFVIAEFVLNEQHVNAYYSHEGELIALARFISTSILPINLQANLKRSYSDYWISELIEVTKNNTITYYATVESGEVVVKLKALAGNDWIRYEKKEK